MGVLALWLGRILLGSIFFLTALHEMMNWSEVLQSLMTTLTGWMNIYYGYEDVVIFFESLLFLSPFLLSCAIGLKLVGSVCLAFGWMPRLGACFLILFLIPTTILMHDFWNSVGPQYSAQVIEFMKNTSILGGLFIVLSFREREIGVRSTIDDVAED